MALAATIALFQPLVDIVFTSPSRAEFHFEQQPQTGELVEKFWSRSLCIEPQAYFSQLRIIKARLREGKGYVV